MSTLDTLANTRLAKRAKDILEIIFKEAEEPIEKHTLAVNEDKGSVTLDGIEFCFIENRLRMVGPCPNCGEDTESLPISDMTDLADQMKRFRPSRSHRCLD